MGGRGTRSFAALYGALSRHIAYRIPARRRASATAAMRLPRRAAILSPHARSAAVSGDLERRRRQPASTKRYRAREFPAFVMRLRFSAELCSPGTSPRNASN